MKRTAGSPESDSAKNIEERTPTMVRDKCKDN